MNPIFSEAVRRMLRRQREAQRKQPDFRVENGVYPPYERIPSLSLHSLPLFRHLNLLRFGLIGALLTALCVFTPVLTVLLSAVGLAGLNDYLKYSFVLALIAFLGIVIYAWRRNRT